MANSILREIASSIKSYKHFTIMIDETTDVINKEQCVLVMRWVHDTLEVNEDFIGLYEINDTDRICHTYQSNQGRIVATGFVMRNIRGQGYDRASAMTGHQSGVAKCIKYIEPIAVLTNCYGHSLNLAVSDSVKACKMMKDVLETVTEIIKLIKFSPRREAILRTVKEEVGSHAAGIRVLFFQHDGLSNTVVLQA